MMSWSQTNPDGLYNYTVSYINAAYISFYNVDIHLYVGGGGGGGRTLSGIFISNPDMGFA